MGDPARPGVALLERLAAAVNSHDLDVLAGCWGACGTPLYQVARYLLRSR
jgi:hypothetical protein